MAGADGLEVVELWALHTMADRRSGCTVEHGRAASTKQRGGATELVFWWGQRTLEEAQEA